MQSQPDPNHYREALLTAQQEVNDEIEALNAWCDPVEPDQSLGRLTRMEAMQDQQMALHQRRRLELRRTRIQTALERLDDGAFGYCVLCKQPIDPRRLESMPESPLCVACLEKRNTAR